MAFAVVLSQGAEDDLEALHAYIALNRSREEADALLGTILDRCDSLATFSFRGSIPKELAALGKDEFRQILVGPYRVVYFVEDGTVVIALIADGRRDMRTLLQARLLNR